MIPLSEAIQIWLQPRRLLPPLATCLAVWLAAGMLPMGWGLLGHLLNDLWHFTTLAVASGSGPPFEQLLPWLTVIPVGAGALLIAIEHPVLGGFCTAIGALLHGGIWTIFCLASMA
jgi:hypothetical protein